MQEKKTKKAKFRQTFWSYLKIVRKKNHSNLDFIAISFSQIQVWSQLQGGDINIQDNIGFTPLMEAISRNNKQAIDILLQNSADLELYDKRDRISFICKNYM